MKKLTVKFEVFVEDETVEGDMHSPESPCYKTMMDLYEHICAWEGNSEGTVAFLDEKIEDEE